MKRITLLSIALLSWGMSALAQGTIERDDVTYSVTLNGEPKDILDPASFENTTFDLSQVKNGALVISVNIFKKSTVTENYFVKPLAYNASVITLSTKWETDPKNEVFPIPNDVSSNNEEDNWDEVKAYALSDDNIYSYSQIVEKGVTTVKDGYGNTCDLNDLDDEDAEFLKTCCFIVQGSGKRTTWYAIDVITVKYQGTISADVVKKYEIFPTLPVIANDLTNNLTLSAGITSVENTAFSKLSRLQTLDASNSTAEISATLLAQVTNYTPNVNLYSKDGGLIFSADGEKLVAILKGTTGTYTISSDVKSIAADAFVNVSNVTINTANDAIAFAGTLTNGNKINKPAETLEITKVSDKIGKVVGTVNQSNIEKLAVGSYRVIDFTEATVVGEVNVNAPLNKLFYFGKDANVKGTNIVVNGVCEDFVIKDENGEEAYIPTKFFAENAKLFRSFNPGYATLILPFAVNTAEFKSAFRPAYFNTYNNKVVSFRYDSNFSANYPYLVEVKSAATSIAATNVEVLPTDDAVVSVDGAAKMAGVYAKKTKWGVDEYMFNSKAAILVPSEAKNNYVNPFRTYITLPGYISNEVKVQFIDEDDNVWDVTDDVKDVLFEGEAANESFYSVNGSKLAAPQKGINVVKKTMSDGSVKTTKVLVK